MTTERATEALANGGCMALIIAAHPDDETIGAAGLMWRLCSCALVYVTDGAPRDPRFWGHAPGRARPGSAVEYARIRRNELARALRLAGIGPHAAASLGGLEDPDSLRVRDQEVVFEISAIARELAGRIARMQPDLILTHAYEGGHPDHDAVAVAVWAACRLLAHSGIEPPPVVEMALYHGASGELTAGEFLPPTRTPNADEMVIPLPEPELRQKHAMLDCFVSQHAVLEPFYALTAERFRVAPLYDFTRSPHEGQLMYERWAFPLSGQMWREAAARELRSLNLFDAAGAAPGGKV